MIENLTTRKCCSDCKANFGRSNADISIGDYWGIDQFEPQKDDNKGVSVILIYSKKGNELLKKISVYINSWEVPLSQIQKYNLGLKGSTSLHKHRSSFFRKIYQANDVLDLIKKELEDTKIEKSIKYIRRFMRR